MTKVKKEAKVPVLPNGCHTAAWPKKKKKLQKRRRRKSDAAVMRLISKEQASSKPPCQRLLSTVA